MKIRQRHHKTWMSLTPTLPKDNRHLLSKHTHAVYVLVRLRACVCACACVCWSLRRAHANRKYVRLAVWHVFSLFPPPYATHLYATSMQMETSRRKHTHAHTHKSIHGHIRTGHTQIHTCKVHARTHTPKQAHAHSHSHGECPVLIRIWRNFENHCKYFGDYCI